MQRLPSNLSAGVTVENTVSFSAMSAPATNKPSTPPYGFDPSHGYDVDSLLKVGSPEEPEDYESFWKDRHEKALATQTLLNLSDAGREENGWRVFDMRYTSTDGVTIHGWVTLPISGRVRKGIVVMHGYGGRTGPDFHLPFEDTALFFPCARGLGSSQHPPISSDPRWHLLHDIDKPRHYVHGGCVEDVWLAFSAMLRIFPHVEGHLGYLGISFGGGIGAMALAWDDRVSRAHFNVPSFGNHPLRLKLPTTGSGAAIQDYHRFHPRTTEKTLSYYDAATAARRIRIPVHCACALYDPMVAPAGQFAVFNALQGEKQLFQLTAGHHPHPREGEENARLLKELHQFFSHL